MKTCTNCKSKITCSCQERVASNGVKVCSSCAVQYEQQLKLLNQTPPKPVTNENPTT